MVVLWFTSKTHNQHTPDALNEFKGDFFHPDGHKGIHPNSFQMFALLSNQHHMYQDGQLIFLVGYLISLLGRSDKTNQRRLLRQAVKTNK